MAASAQTRYYHGSSPGSAGSDVTGATVRYKLADNDITDTNNPVPLPGTGLGFSWRKASKVNFVTSPAGAITNLRWFISGGPPANIRYFARSNAVYTQGSSADTSGITGFTDTPTNQNNNDATQYTVTSPLVVNAGTVLSNPSTGEGSQNFVETQAAVNAAYLAGPGPIPPFQVTYRYTET